MISEKTYNELRKKLYWIKYMKAIPLSNDDEMLMNKMIKKIKEYESRIRRTK